MHEAVTTRRSRLLGEGGYFYFVQASKARTRQSSALSLSQNFIPNPCSGTYA